MGTLTSKYCSWIVRSSFITVRGVGWCGWSCRIMANDRFQLNCGCLSFELPFGGSGTIGAAASSGGVAMIDRNTAGSLSGGSGAGLYRGLTYAAHLEDDHYPYSTVTWAPQYMTTTLTLLC